MVRAKKSNRAISNSASSTSAISPTAGPSTSSNSGLTLQISDANKILSKIYYDPKQEGSYYTTLSKIMQNKQIQAHNISKNEVRQWLKSQESVTNHT